VAGACIRPSSSACVKFKLEHAWSSAHEPIATNADRSQLARLKRAFGYGPLWKPEPF
jgi:hypothetical protein